MKLDGFDLQRFVSAQQLLYATASPNSRRSEADALDVVQLPAGPGVGYSSAAQRYAIRSVDEATAYLAHPILGVRLSECTRAMLGAAGSAHSILGLRTT
jgi:uncharacterized protein (DUF1810 family)